jgi:hypothetical protein
MRFAALWGALLLCACSLDTRGDTFFWPVGDTGEETSVTDWLNDFDDHAAEGPDGPFLEDPDAADLPLVDTVIEVVETHDPVQDEPAFELITDPVPDPVEEEIIRPCEPLEGGACSLVDNCNCSAGQACRLHVDFSCNLYEICVPNTGTLPTDSTCSPETSLDEDQCLPGNICLRSGGPSDYFCFKWCMNHDDCPVNHECTGSAEFWSYDCGTMVPAYGICRWM